MSCSRYTENGFCSTDFFCICTCNYGAQLFFKRSCATEVSVRNKQRKNHALKFLRLFLYGLPFVFFPLLFLVIAMLPDELDFSVQTPQYMEFYVVTQQKYIRTIGTAACDSGENAQTVRLRFPHGGTPDQFAIQCGYEPVRFSLCSDIIYKRFGMIMYRMNISDFLKSYHIPGKAVCSGTEELKIRIEGSDREDHIFWPRKDEIRENFSFAGIHWSRKFLSLFFFLGLFYCASIFFVTGKDLIFTEHKVELFSWNSMILAGILCFVHGVAYGFNTISCILWFIGFRGVIFGAEVLLAIIFPPKDYNEMNSERQSAESPHLPHRIDFDVLRIVAAFFVVVIHVSGWILYSFPADSPDWMIVNFFNTLARFAVPVFFMISGA